MSWFPEDDRKDVGSLDNPGYRMRGFFDMKKHAETTRVESIIDSLDEDDDE